MNYDIEKLVYLIWLSTCSDPGSEDAFRLLDRFGDARAIFEADSAELRDALGSEKAIIGKIMNHDIDKARNILRTCRELDINVLPYDSEEYPKRLCGISGRPLLLYSKGHVDRLNERLCVGVVGTRAITAYGLYATKKISYEICLAGAVVVSGGAYGVDSYANGTAATYGFETVAVFGCGIDVMYPKENTEMFRAISKRGMLISEYPPGTPPYRSNFPARNRIISGMSDAVVVVEAGKRSGSLITAGYAQRQKRRLYAVPGPIDSPGSSETNKLIQDGAQVCVSGTDVLADFVDSFSHVRERLTVKDNRWVLKEDKGDRSKEYRNMAPGQPAAHLVEETTAPEDSAVPEPIQKKMKSPPTEMDLRRDARYVASLPPLSGSEKIVYDRIPAGTQVLPEVLCGDDLRLDEVLSTLTMLEISGHVEMLPGGFCRRAVTL